jgi:hypothetical protein
LSIKRARHFITCKLITAELRKKMKRIPMSPAYSTLAQNMVYSNSLQKY